jgi:hypothetical protein
MANLHRYLKPFLYLVTLHTLGVGIVLIVANQSVMGLFGFVENESRFFQMQGGVFHVLVSYLYLKASRDPGRNLDLVRFMIAVKAAATVFLFSYYLFVESVIMILLSGIIDAAMGLVVLILYLQFKKV